MTDQENDDFDVSVLEDEDDVDIVVPEEGGDGEDPDQGDQETEKKPDAAMPEVDHKPAEKRDRKKEYDANRISRWQSQVREAEERAAAAEARAKELEGRVKTSEDDNIKQHEAIAEQGIQSARLKLRAAKESGDVEAEITAQEELAKAQAYKMQVDAYKYNLQRQPNKQEEQPKKEPVRQREFEEPVGNPILDRWMSRNTWFDEESDDYDDEKAEDVRLYADKLEKLLQRAGRALEIGNKAYFDQIDRYVAQHYGNGAEKTRTPAMDGGSKVAGQKRSSAGTPGSPAKKEVVLTAMQKQVALSLDLRKPDGSPMSNQEKLKDYARRHAAESDKRKIDREIMNQRGV